MRIITMAPENRQDQPVEDGMYMRRFAGIAGRNRKRMGNSPPELLHKTGISLKKQIQRMPGTMETGQTGSGYFPGKTVGTREKRVRRRKTFVHLTGKLRENPPVSVQSTEK